MDYPALTLITTGAALTLLGLALWRGWFRRR